MKLIVLILYIIIIILLWNNRIKYSKEVHDLRDIKLRFGDIILFRSKDATIYHDLFSPFTHVGMMIDNKNILEMNSDKFDLYEDMGEKTRDVNIYNMELRWAYYSSGMYLLRIKKDADEGKRREFMKLLEENKGTKFHEKVKNEIFNCATINYFQPLQDKDTKFCSEFIAYCLSKVGMIDRNYRCVFPTTFLEFKDENGKIYSDNLIKIK